MKDLLKLYSFESVHDSEGEKKIFDWICKWLNEHNIKYSTEGCNIYHLTGENPVILSAHLDQVKTNGRAAHFRMVDNKTIVAYNEGWERTSLGADDKNGIWCILKTLENCETPIDFVISAGEEVGCVGIERLEVTGALDVINENQICIVLDRKGTTDILKGGSCDTYCLTLAPCLKNYLGGDYKVTTGSISDTRVLCLYCESVNMSTAYFSPHTSTETTDFESLQLIQQNVMRIVTDFQHYPTPPVDYLTYKTTKKNNSTNWGGYKWEGYYND